MHHLHKHGHRPKSGSSPTYRTWVSMKARCSNKNNIFYGGKGVQVCDEWMSFEVFLKDMGERPDGCTIDRIDPSKGYFKENCRWATSRQQCRNKKNNVFISVNGEKLNLVDVSTKYGIPVTTLSRRVKEGLSGLSLISKENRNKGKRKKSKLTDAEVALIKNMLSAGATQLSVAKKFGVSQPTISTAIRRHYGDIEVNGS